MLDYSAPWTKLWLKKVVCIMVLNLEKITYMLKQSSLARDVLLALTSPLHTVHLDLESGLWSVACEGGVFRLPLKRTSRVCEYARNIAEMPGVPLRASFLPTRSNRPDSAFQHLQDMCFWTLCRV
jgi:hypothetical protein